MWQSVVLWNGDVTICCYDYNGDYKIGNIFENGGFKEIYKSKKYGEIRRKIMKGELAICENCEGKNTGYGVNYSFRNKNQKLTL